MEKYLQVLSKSRLFRELEGTEILTLLDCIGGVLRPFAKREILLLAGEPVDSIGILLKGKVQVIYEDIAGNRRILEELLPGGIFAETMACLNLSRSPFSVVAEEEGDVLSIPFGRMVRSCGSACAFHSKLTKNMMILMAEKNWHLRKKVELLSLKTTREKLMYYFLDQARKAGALKYTLPFSRSEMADYLSVDRSAMCRELGRMQQDGLITIDRRKIELHKRNV